MSDNVPDISVVIPVYNAELYFPAVFDKIQHQTFCNIEIIIVDDNSHDSTYDLISEYASNDSRIIILKNETTSGAGACRNKGLEIAKGKYVIFLDDDDFVDSNLLERLFDIATARNADVVVFRSQFIDWKTKITAPIPWTIREDLLPDNDIFSAQDIKFDFFRAFVWWPWDKFYNRQTIISQNVKFQEIRTSNDLFFTAAQMLLASRITILPDYLIQHTVSRESSLENTREVSWFCALEALQALKQFLVEQLLYSERKKDFENYSLSFIKWNMDTLSGDAYFKFYESARKFIHSCEINKSEIYEHELCSFYENVMSFSPEEYLFFTRGVYFVRARDLESQLADLKKSVDESTHSFFKSQQEISCLNDSLDSCLLEVSMAKKALQLEQTQCSLLTNQIEELKRKIKTITHSKSWRYTKLFRVLMSVIKKMF